MKRIPHRQLTFRVSPEVADLLDQIAISLATQTRHEPQAGRIINKTSVIEHMIIEKAKQLRIKVPKDALAA